MLCGAASKYLGCWGFRKFSPLCLSSYSLINNQVNTIKLNVELKRSTGGCAAIPCQKSCSPDPPFSNFKIERTQGIGDAHLLKRVLKGSFFLDEPVISFLGLHGGEGDGELINLMMEGIDFNQSLVAKNVFDGCIVGFALVGEYSQDRLHSDLTRWTSLLKDARNRKLIEIWKAISEKFDYRDVCSGRAMELFYLGVVPEARGKGLGKKLVSSSVNVARLCGYNIMQVICTSNRSAYICKSLGLRHHASIKYDTLYMSDGRRIMSNSPPPPDEKVEIYFQPISCCK